MRPVARVSEDLGEAMVGIDISRLEPERAVANAWVVNATRGDFSLAGGFCGA